MKVLKEMGPLLSRNFWFMENLVWKWMLVCFSLALRNFYNWNNNIWHLYSALHRTQRFYAHVKGHLEPTHLKSSPLFTFSTKLLGQDSPSIHLFSKMIGSRFTTTKIKLGEDSSSWFVFLGQDSLSNKENNKTMKRTFVQDSPCFKYY